MIALPLLAVTVDNSGTLNQVTVHHTSYIRLMLLLETMSALSWCTLGLQRTRAQLEREALFLLLKLCAHRLRIDVHRKNDDHLRLTGARREMYVAVRQFQVGVGHGVQRGEVHGHLHGCGKSTGVTLHLHGVTCFDFLNQQFLHRCLAAAAATAFPHERCRRRRHRYATASTALTVAFVAAGAHSRDLGQQLARHTPSEPSPLCCRRRRRRCRPGRRVRTVRITPARRPVQRHPLVFSLHK
mmetsp:Transcript_24209/g.38964  ORF Transcript_24209/g.38964 Transcript_24209/m.38964 type:complete len:241 (-) Transcript_24209:440-1162(-)